MQGKTVEVGRAHFDTTAKRYTILDAPGHKNYVPNMIAGACQADIGVLVISARKGEIETGFDRGGQTREHAMLAKTLGVRHLVIVINKIKVQVYDGFRTRSRCSACADHPQTKQRQPFVTLQRGCAAPRAVQLRYCWHM